MTFLTGVIAFAIGYWIGKRMGVAQTMLRMEGIIADLQQIEMTWRRAKNQWNEDNL
jgi:hypothetical protein